jgi:hypothetical protein
MFYSFHICDFCRLKNHPLFSPLSGPNSKDPPQSDNHNSVSIQITQSTNFFARFKEICMQLQNLPTTTISNEIYCCNGQSNHFPFHFPTTIHTCQSNHFPLHFPTTVHTCVEQLNFMVGLKLIECKIESEMCPTS